MNIRFQPPPLLAFGGHASLRNITLSLHFTFTWLFLTWNNLVCWSTICKQLLPWEWEQMAAASGTRTALNWLTRVLLRRKVCGIAPRFLLLLANIMLKWGILLKSFTCKNETKSWTLAQGGIHAQTCRPSSEMVIFHLMCQNGKIKCYFNMTLSNVLVLLVAYTIN